jgi:hypothetical protein
MIVLGWLLWGLGLLIVWLLGGVMLGAWFYADRRRVLRQREALLRMQQDALERARRIDEGFWNARMTLLNEAIRTLSAKWSS